MTEIREPWRTLEQYKACGDSAHAKSNGLLGRRCVPCALYELDALRARLAEVEAERDAWKKQAAVTAARAEDDARAMRNGFVVSAREKAKDERIRVLTEALEKYADRGNWSTSGNFEPRYAEGSIARKALSTPSPSQPVKVAEGRCDHQKSDYHAMSMCPKCSPPAEKLTGTGEEPK